MKDAIELDCCKTDINLVPLMPDEDRNSGGSLRLDLNA